MADQNQNRKQYTKQGYQELLDELRRRQQEEREKIREDIAVAKSFGDLSENSEYDAARTAQAENEARILELEALIENAIVVDENALDDGTIGLGSIVVLLPLWSCCKLTSERGEKNKKGETTHGSNFNETTS